jgi:uncharacterized protein YggU (UPF0235/DUF167 family)
MRVTIRAHPGARQERVICTGPGALEVWVRGAAREGRANLDIQRVLGEALGVRKSAVRIVLGHTTRDKVIDIEGVDTLPPVKERDGRSN